MKGSILNIIKKEKKFIGIVIIIVVVGIASMIFKDGKEEIVFNTTKYTLLENDYYTINYNKAYDGTVREDDKDAYQFNEQHQLVSVNNRIVDDNFEYIFEVNIEYDNNTVNYTSSTTSNGNLMKTNNFYELQYENDLIDIIDKKSVNTSSDGSQNITNSNCYFYYDNNKKISKIISKYYSKGDIIETVVNDFEYYDYDNEVIVCEKININSKQYTKDITLIYYEKDIKKDILSQIGQSMSYLYKKNIIEKNLAGGILSVGNIWNISFYNVDRVVYANEKGYAETGNYESEIICEYENNDLLGMISKETDAITKEVQTKKYAVYKEDDKYYYLSETNREKIQQLLDAKNKKAEKNNRLSSNKEYALIYEYDYADQNNITETNKIISQGSKLFKKIKAYEFNIEHSQKIIAFVLNSKKTESPVYDYKKEPQKYVEQYLLDNKIIEKYTYAIEAENGMGDDKNAIVYHITNKHGGTIGWYSLNKTTGEIIDYMMDDGSETPTNENQSGKQNNNKNTETGAYEQPNNEIVPDNESQDRNDNNDKEKEYQDSLKVIQYIEKNMNQINGNIYKEAYKMYKNIEWKSSRSIDMKTDLSIIIMEVELQEAMTTQEISYLKNMINDFKNKYR